MLLPRSVAAAAILFLVTGQAVAAPPEPQATPAAPTYVARAPVPKADTGDKDGKPPARWELPMFAEWNIKEISFSDAREKIQRGEIAAVIVREQSRAQMFLKAKDGREFRSYVPGRIDASTLLVGDTDVRAEGVPLAQAIFEVIFLLVNMLLMGGLLWWLWSMAGKFSGTPAKQMGKIAKEDRITFEDVAGQDEAKRELQEVVAFLKDPKKFSGLGARVPKGVLMDGDPGNGKTMLAKAIAGEAGVPFFHVAGSDVLEMYAGLGARRIRKTFKECRKKAPCILFIDELDTIGGKRGAGGGSDVQNEREQILNALLVEMDGVGRTGTVVVIGATNRPDMLDPALVRPGRLDRRVHVPKPDMQGRADILKVHARKITLAADIDLAEVARMTPGFSGADLANLFNEAAIIAGRRGKAAVDMECVHAARDKALMGEERRSGAITEEERRVAAYHEAGHAVVALRSPHSDPVHKISIVPRGRALGVVVRLPERDRVLISRAKLEADLAVAMAGRAAEEIQFGPGSVTTGAVADIEQATAICREMAGRWGMYDELGRVNYFGRSDGSGYGHASPTSLARVDEVVRQRLDEAYQRALDILKAEWSGLEALVTRLEEVETLTGAEALAIIDAVKAPQS